MKLTNEVKSEIRELLIVEAKKLIGSQSEQYEFRVDWQNSFCYDKDIQHINNHGLMDRDYIFNRGINYAKNTDLKDWYEYNWLEADLSCLNNNRKYRVRIDLKQYKRNKKLKLY